MISFGADLTLHLLCHCHYHYIVTLFKQLLSPEAKQEQSLSALYKDCHHYVHYTHMIMIFFSLHHPNYHHNHAHILLKVPYLLQVR